MRRSLLGTLVLCCVACRPGDLPPYGEALVSVDTDLPVVRLAIRLRVDVYAEDGTWIESRDISRRNTEDWPASFSVYTTDASDRPVLVRLRAYPEGKVRDYRGERFQARPPEGNPVDLIAEPEPTDTPRLLVEGRDLTPTVEPLPNLTVDRLLAVRLVPGARGTAQVVLSGWCLGTMADVTGRASCIDQEDTRVPVVEEVLSAEIAPGPPSVRVSTFGAEEPCSRAPRPGHSSQDGVPLYDEEVCVPGGLFFLGDAFATGLGWDAAPERAALISPLLVDRYEVTVGRFRQALKEGFLPERNPLSNSDPLVTSDDESDPTHLETWSDQPLGREEFPLNGIHWHIARELCRFYGGDLLTEAQWEYVAAAAGRPRETRYPFSDAGPTCDGVVFARSAKWGDGSCVAQGQAYGPQAVSASFHDVTPGLGIVGLGGSLSEWVLDPFAPYASRCWSRAPLRDPRCDYDKPDAKYFAPYRGGAWISAAEWLAASVRVDPFPNYFNNYQFGFRCARRGDQP